MSVPKTMADKSFEDTKWIIKSNGDKPDEWNDSNLRFFSETFINFLVDKCRVEHFQGAADLYFK